MVISQWWRILIPMYSLPWSGTDEKQGKADRLTCQAFSGVKLGKWEVDTSTILRQQHSYLASHPAAHLATVPRPSRTPKHLTAEPELGAQFSPNKGYWTFLLLGQPQYSVSA